MGNFKDWLRGAIAKNDWKYKKLAEAVGAKEASISQWVNGEHVPKPPVLYRLAIVAHEDPFKLLNLAYDWPMPSDEMADERLSGIIRYAKSMSDSDLEKLEDYLRFLTVSSNGRPGNQGSQSPKLSVEEIIAAMRVIPEQERKAIIKAYSSDD